jgi:hypothetical protein
MLRGRGVVPPIFLGRLTSLDKCLQLSKLLQECAYSLTSVAKGGNLEQNLIQGLEDSMAVVLATVLKHMFVLAEVALQIFAWDQTV